MLGMHGIRYGIKHPEILKAELNALRRVAKENKEVGFLLPQVISVEELEKVKEIIKEINFSQAKVGIMIETPSAVQLIKDFCQKGIDFISFGTNDLTQYILALDRGNEQVQGLYNEMHPAVLHQLEFVIRVCKRNNVETSICGQAGSKKEMVKFLVEKGIDSISVNADVAKEISDYIAELEKERGEEPRQYEPEKKKQENEIKESKNSGNEVKNEFFENKNEDSKEKSNKDFKEETKNELDEEKSGENFERENKEKSFDTDSSNNKLSYNEKENKEGTKKEFEKKIEESETKEESENKEEQKENFDKKENEKYYQESVKPYNKNSNEKFLSIF
ncbi:MAG: hypothetical protein P8X70_02930 [Nanoarchaeota archaeon]